MALDAWDDHADGWDVNKDVRIFAKKAFGSLIKKAGSLVPNLADARVLDFGCGTGLLSEKLAPLCRNIVAVDTSARMIDVLRSKVIEKNIENIMLLQAAINAGAVEQHPELADKFDLIVASSVCSFLPDYEATLRDLSSMMKPGGCFVQWDWLADMPISRIREAYEATGLKVIGVEEAYAMEMENGSMPVVMGIAQSPLVEFLAPHV